EVCEGFETIGEWLSQGIAGCPDVGGLGKIPLHRGEPFRHVFGHAVEQEGNRPLLERTALPRPQQSAVKQGRRGGDRMGSHAGWLRRSMAPWQSSLHFPLPCLSADHYGASLAHGRRRITTTFHFHPFARRAEFVPRRMEECRPARARRRAADAVRRLPRTGRRRRRLRAMLGETVVHREALLPEARDSLCLRSRA